MKIHLFSVSLLSLMSLTLFGCSQDYLRAVKVGGSLTLTGESRSPITPDQVRVYTGSVPCQYEEIGLIMVPGGAFSVDTLYQFFRERAAEVGASIVDVQQIDKLIWEYRGTAIAGECLGGAN